MTIRTEPMTVNVGPQHPSTHGVFRLRITFDGEEILEVEPVLGYLHRGTEKLAEERNYVQVVTLTDRLDYTSSMINNQLTAWPWKSFSAWNPRPGPNS